MDNNSSCGSQYSYRRSDYDVTWTWFMCKQTGKCIHNTTRCDMHPHPDCLYENEDGEMVAEDEEGCLEEYKRKGLVAKSANFQCQSPIRAASLFWPGIERFIFLFLKVRGI